MNRDRCRRAVGTITVLTGKATGFGLLFGRAVRLPIDHITLAGPIRLGTVRQMRLGGRVVIVRHSYFSAAALASAEKFIASPLAKYDVVALANVLPIANPRA